jgi:hypothetical protein
VQSILDYATPSKAKPPNRWIGWPIAAISFGISLFVAADAVGEAYTLRHFIGCGFEHQIVLNSLFVDDLLFGSIAIVGWIICQRVRAGIHLCRIGAAVAALVWIGACASTFVGL